MISETVGGKGIFLHFVKPACTCAGRVTHPTLSIKTANPRHENIHDTVCVHVRTQRGPTCINTHSTASTLRSCLTSAERRVHIELAPRNNSTSQSTQSQQGRIPSESAIIFCSAESLSVCNITIELHHHPSARKNALLNCMYISKNPHQTLGVCLNQDITFVGKREWELEHAATLRAEKMRPPHKYGSIIYSTLSGDAHRCSWR